MPKLSSLYSREILDSRATPTVEVVAVFDTGDLGVSSVPSGSSTGASEAVELRDNDPNRYLGKGVLHAVANINGEIAQHLIGKDISSVSQVDDFLIKLDGTPNKARLGANAILGVSIAVTKALSSQAKLPLYKYIAGLADNKDPLFIPTPVFNMINGGKHGAGNLDFQEFHVIPSRLKSFQVMLETGAEIYQMIKKLLARRGAIHSIGDEGGFAPNLFTNLDALEILKESIIECHHKPSVDVDLGLDVASNSFYKDDHYTIKDRSSPMDSAEFVDYLRDLNDQYHLKLLEDALNENDWKGWSQLTQELGNITTIVADDLVVTNKTLLQRAITEKACSGVIIKPNQIGTVTETLEVVKLAKSSGIKLNVSHRSGETNDTFIADFAVGVGSDYAKFGAPARGERVAKYNRFLSIEVELGLPVT
jgi:enolase